MYKMNANAKIASNQLGRTALYMNNAQCRPAYIWSLLHSSDQTEIISDI